jgi:stage II sporulation protein E
MNIPFRTGKQSSLRQGIIAFIGVLIPEIFLTYLQGLLMYDILKSLLNGFIIFSLVYVFRNVLLLLEGKEKKYVLSNEEILSIAMACILTIAGLGQLSVYGISVRNILCILLILIFSNKSGAGTGAAMGVIVGTVISLSSNSSPAVIAAYAFCGLLSGILKNLGKIGSCIGVIMGNALLTYYTNGSTEILIYLYEILAAIGIFLIIPQKAIDFIVRKFDKTFKNAGEKRGYSTRIKDITVEKLNKFSNAFAEMSKTFDEISETKTVTENHDITSIFDRVADRVCKDCSLCLHCWDMNFCNTYQVMFKIVEKLDNKGWIEQKDIPDYFLERCERIDDFVIAVNNVFELFKVDMMWKSKICESRGLVSQQLKSMSKIISNLACELNTDICFKSDIEDQISTELYKLGIKNSEAVVYENKAEKYEISISHKGCGGKRVCLNSMEKVISQIVGRSMVKESNECYINPKSNICSVRFVEQETYKVMTGVSKVSKSEEYISGDNYTFLNPGDGKYISALSDGMGSGHKACIQSKATISLIEQFMESGFDKDTTVKLINSILVLRSNDDSFATIDMSLIDLYNGEIEFVKIGAAPTFIKHNDTIETVKAASLPAGILSDVEIELIHKKVGNGDFVIMVTDGIIDAYKQCNDSNKSLQDDIQGINSRNPQEIADRILDLAVNCCNDGQPIDDMMVLVSKVWKAN